MFPPTISEHYERYKEASKKSQEKINFKPNEGKNSA
jgi:hypothetical protein